MDETAFLRSLHEDPHDELRLLVYADWLEEKGDDRADFLRLECFLRRRTAADSEFPEALLRWRDWLARLPKAWLQALRWRVNGLPLPKNLIELLEQDRWKSSDLEPFYLESDAAVVAYTIECMQGETAAVWSGSWFGAADANHPPGDVDPGLAFLIGGDSPFALDFRNSVARPRVLQYRWRMAGRKDGNRWVQVADCFEDFWRGLSRERDGGFGRCGQNGPA